MKRNKRKLGILFIILLVIIIISILIVQVINDKITPTIMEYSKSEMKRMASIILNKSASDNILNDFDMNKLFIINKNTNEEVISVTLDSLMVNQITNRISDECEKNLRKIEDGKFSDVQKEFNIAKDYFYVPIGIVFKNTMLSGVGPKIPIRIKMVGNVTSGVISDVKEYGINNSLITISVEMHVELVVLLPFSTDYVNITNVVPIAIKLIQGKVPQFYGGTLLR